jgi:ParB family transcriptional regulator, chromosome partitioning protein
MGGLWQLDRVSAIARDAAESAARDSGLPLTEWLSRMIVQTANAEDVLPAIEPPPAPRPIPSAPPVMPPMILTVPPLSGIEQILRPIPAASPRPDAPVPPRPASPPTQASAPAQASGIAAPDSSTLLLPPAVFDIGTVGTRHGESDAPEALVAAIAREGGIRQPILVRRKPSDDGRYEIIAGRRRWRAARRLGLTQIAAVVTNLGDPEAVLASLTENLALGDLSPIDEARAYLRLMTEFSLDPRDVTAATGRDISHIVRTLRLMGLPPRLKELVSSGRLTRGHAYALLDMPDPERAAEQMLAEQAGIGETPRLVASPSGVEHRP